MYSDQGCSSVFVSWTKQVCLQTRINWWQWWGTPDIIWNRVPDRRRSKRKWTITKCCLTVCKSIEKRHGVWAGANVAGVLWLSMQHASDIWWCSTAVAVVAQTSYFVGASYFDGNSPLKRYQWIQQWTLIDNRMFICVRCWRKLRLMQLCCLCSKKAKSHQLCEKLLFVSVLLNCITIICNTGFVQCIMDE